MSEIAEIIDSIENKVQKLLDKIDHLEKKNQVLQQALTVSNKNMQNQHNVFEELKKDIESLKMTNSLLGSEDYKRDMKLKINSLIREIDYCVAQLSD